MTGDSSASPRALFKRFLAERWFGGPDFESWVRQHTALEGELRALRDQWLRELEDPESSALLPSEGGPRRALSFAPGEELGGFRLVARLGSGAAGEVWSAEELALGRQVALKLLRPDLALDPRAMERFRREALSGAKLDHPGVVAVYSIGRVHGQPFIAQELVEGGRTLADWVEQARGLSGSAPSRFDEAAALVAQAAEALAAVHACGILHRDIKPRNLLVTKDGRVKVADFGLAHLAGQDELSRTGDVMGTFAYMSPGQVRGEVKGLDGRSDVFSLGATLYELLTLRRAFDGSSMHEVARRILHEDPTPPRSVEPRLPADLEHITRKALEKRAADRYTDMAAFAADLRAFLAREPIQARAASLTGRARRWIRRHPSTSASLSVVLLALGAMTWLNVLHARERKRDRVEALHARALYAIEAGDMVKAQEEVEEAELLGGQDASGHLILALGFAREGRFPEVERSLTRAQERGFDPDDAEIGSGLGHAARALFLMTRHDPSVFPEAERHIDDALGLDPKLYSLEFARYLMRMAVGDAFGAGKALSAFRRHIPPADPLSQVLAALELELSGSSREALETLERLAADPELGSDGLTRLRWHRVAGRLCVTLGEFARGQAYLERAVAEAPSDCYSLDNLAVSFMNQALAGDERASTREAAREYAQLARDCNGSLANPDLVLAYLSVSSLDAQAGVPDLRALPAHREARERLDRLAAHPSGVPAMARTIESHLVFLEGSAPYRSGRYVEASEHFERALELDPDNALAAALLGQCLWHLERPEEGLAVLERGLALWDDPSWMAYRKSDWLLGALVVWRMGAAGKAGRRDDFVRAVERFRRELAGGARFQWQELLTAAEFLATAPEGLRDCDFVWQLVDEHDLARVAEGTPAEAQAQSTLAKIELACR
jgi:serine/threonine protein kinase